MKFFLLALILSLTACGGSGGFTPASQTSPPGTNSNDNIQLYFSRPGTADADRYINGPEEYLISAIRRADRSIDMAMYELSLRNVMQSLIDAHQRGVRVRVLTDTDNLGWERFKEMATAGIPVRGDQRSALMHNKFLIIDHQEVWTGSMNLTYFGAYRNRENLLRLQSVQAAANYTEEFNQLWAGIHNQANAADNYFSIDKIPVDVFFSPDDNFRSTRLLPLLRQAKQSVHMLAFAFTSRDIATELVALKQRGVEVKIVVDSSQSGQTSSQYDDLLAQQMDIRRDGQAFKLHHKVIIIDQRHVITGSYNFSENAESRNDENSVVIENEALANRFEQEFSDIYNRSTARPAVYRDVIDTRF